MPHWISPKCNGFPEKNKRLKSKIALNNLKLKIIRLKNSKLKGFQRKENTEINPKK